MAYRPKRMKFGMFLAPFHRVGENPTLALKRDMKLLELLDELGYEEAWIGEHHSFGRETIADPVVFMAAAAERTRRIKLGTGVLSLPYHHPLMVADRMVQLDHMTEGRVMLGCGPGALTSDAHMMGIPTVEQRKRMGESLDAIMALFRGERVTTKTDWFELKDARLQLNNFSDPHLPVAVAASFTPAGPTAAGKQGVGLLSVAGVDNKAFERTWGWVEEAAQESGRTVSRDNWRVVMTMHVADSRKEALQQLEAGYAVRAYSGDSRNPAAAGAGGLFGGAGGLEGQAESGAALIGSPDDVIKAIEQVIERSGGIGGILSLGHEWASTEATNRSYELFARYVAPHFQNQLEAIHETRAWVEDNMREVFGANAQAMARAFTDAGKELPAPMAEAEAKRLEREAAKAKAKT
jgi:limonene 1,2-monooxygenase